MKFSLFNGLIAFEGNPTELKAFLENLPELTEKLTDMQKTTNDVVYEHQEKIFKLQGAVGMRQQFPGSPGLSQ